ncbi:MAG: alpha-1,2-fucosyltransferase [Bacteroidia bacterium]
MMLVRVTGGLGNQLFQFALGTSLAQQNHTFLKIDTSLLLNRSEPHEVVTHRELDLDFVFRLDLQFASDSEIRAFNGTSYTHLPGKIYNRLRWELGRKNKLVVENKRSFQPEILRLPDNRCLVGSWQSEKYFWSHAQDIRNRLVFRHTLGAADLELSGRIRAQHSVCLSTRRGDYVTSPVYSKTLGALPAGYFERAVETLMEKRKVDCIYVFSDDEQWARANLNFPVETVFVDKSHSGPRYSTKFQLMTCCKHFIIPNSTFGWWAAWLGADPEKTVVAPAQWYKDSALDGSDIVPQSWLKI